MAGARNGSGPSAAAGEVLAAPTTHQMGTRANSASACPGRRLVIEATMHL